MDRRWDILAVAAFGGVAPTLLNAAIASQKGAVRVSIVVANPWHALDIVATFLLVILLMAILGAGVAYAFQETEMRKAFFIGLGLPSLLTVGSVAGTQAPPVGGHGTAGAPTALFRQFFPVVHARQESTAEVMLELKFPSDLKVTEMLAIFDVDDGPDVARTFRVGTPVPVPMGAQSVELDSAIYFSQEIDLPQNPSGPIVVVLRQEPNRFFGFWTALGVRSRPYRLVAVN